MRVTGEREFWDRERGSEYVRASDESPDKRDCSRKEDGWKLRRDTKISSEMPGLSDAHSDTTMHELSIFADNGGSLARL